MTFVDGMDKDDISSQTQILFKIFTLKKMSLKELMSFAGNSKEDRMLDEEEEEELDFEDDEIKQPDYPDEKEPKPVIEIEDESDEDPLDDSVKIKQENHQKHHTDVLCRLLEQQETRSSSHLHQFLLLHQPSPL